MSKYKKSNFLVWFFAILIFLSVRSECHGYVMDFSSFMITDISTEGSTPAVAETVPIHPKVISPKSLKINQKRETASRYHLFSPSLLGFKEISLLSSVGKIGRMSGVYGVLVFRGDNKAAEQYFRSGSHSKPHNMKSASKSVLSALTGIAIEKGLLSIDQKISDFFPIINELPDSRKKDITIRHLLTMTSGLQPTSYQSYNNWVANGEWLKNALKMPLVADPGTRHQYSTGDSHILSAVLTSASGMSTKEFAEINLFTPMQIVVHGWEVDPQGIYQGGNNLSIIPEDMVKFGILYLNNGRFEGQQLVPENWVEESTNSTNFGRHPVYGNYGYMWYTSPAGKDAFVAVGYGGQYIYVSPEDNCIVVIISTLESKGKQWEKELFDNIHNGIIASITDSLPTDVAEQGIALTRLNIRKGPGLKHNIESKLDVGQVVDVISWQDEWIQIAAKGRKGWVSAKYVSILEHSTIALSKKTPSSNNPEEPALDSFQPETQELNQPDNSLTEMKERLNNVEGEQLKIKSVTNSARERTGADLLQIKEKMQEIFTDRQGLQRQGKELRSDLDQQRLGVDRLEVQQTTLKNEVKQLSKQQTELIRLKENHAKLKEELNQQLIKIQEKILEVDQDVEQIISARTAISLEKDKLQTAAVLQAEKTAEIAKIQEIMKEELVNLKSTNSSISETVENKQELQRASSEQLNILSKQLENQQNLLDKLQQGKDISKNGRAEAYIALEDLSQKQNTLSESVTKLQILLTVQQNKINDSLLEIQQSDRKQQENLGSLSGDITLLQNNFSLNNSSNRESKTTINSDLSQFNNRIEELKKNVEDNLATEQMLQEKMVTLRKEVEDTVANSDRVTQKIAKLGTLMDLNNKETSDLFLEQDRIKGEFDKLNTTDTSILKTIQSQQDSQQIAGKQIEKINKLLENQQVALTQIQQQQVDNVMEADLSKTSALIDDLTQKHQALQENIAQINTSKIERNDLVEWQEKLNQQLVQFNSSLQEVTKISNTLSEESKNIIGDLDRLKLTEDQTESNFTAVGISLKELRKQNKSLKEKSQQHDDKQSEFFLQVSKQIETIKSGANDQQTTMTSLQKELLQTTNKVEDVIAGNTALLSENNKEQTEVDKQNQKTITDIAEQQGKFKTELQEFQSANSVIMESIQGQQESQERVSIQVENLNKLINDQQVTISSLQKEQEKKIGQELLTETTVSMDNLIKSNNIIKENWAELQASFNRKMVEIDSRIVAGEQTDKSSLSNLQEEIDKKLLQINNTLLEVAERQNDTSEVNRKNRDDLDRLKLNEDQTESHFAAVGIALKELRKQNKFLAENDQLHSGKLDEIFTNLSDVQKSDQERQQNISNGVVANQQNFNGELKTLQATDATILGAIQSQQESQEKISESVDELNQLFQGQKLSIIQLQQKKEGNTSKETLNKIEASLEDLANTQTNLQDNMSQLQIGLADQVTRIEAKISEGKKEIDHDLKLLGSKETASSSATELENLRTLVQEMAAKVFQDAQKTNKFYDDLESYKLGMNRIEVRQAVLEDKIASQKEEIKKVSGPSKTEERLQAILASLEEKTDSEGEEQIAELSIEHGRVNQEQYDKKLDVFVATPAKVEAALPDIKVAEPREIEKMPPQEKVSKPVRIIKPSSKKVKLQSRLIESKTFQTVETISAKNLPAYSTGVELVESWSKAWSSQNVDDYLSYYSDNFAPSNKMELQSWKKHRRSRLTKPKFIEITTNNIRVISMTTSKATVTFDQTYKSNTYSDQSKKTLQLRWETGTWKIVKERSK